MQETNFTNLPDDKSENAQPSNDIKPNSDDNVSLTVTLELESKETRSCEDTSKISENNRISFEDEKEAAGFYKVCNIGKCIGITITSDNYHCCCGIRVFLVIYVGQNDRKDIPEASMSTLMVKNMTCFPILHSAMAGTGITCVCSLQNVPRITAIHITGRQFHHEYTSDDGLTGSFESNSVSLMVDPDAEDQISLTLTSVTCEMEGEVIIEVNGNLSDIVSLRIIGNPETPKVTVKEPIYRNQRTSFTCSGNVGRTEDGLPAETLSFDVLPKGSDEPISISRPSIQVVSNTSDCENHITIMYDIVAVDMMDGAVFSCVSSHKENNAKLFIESSVPIVIMDVSLL